MHPIAETIPCALAKCVRAIVLVTHSFHWRQLLTRHARPCAGQSRLTFGIAASKTWMRGPSPRMTGIDLGSFRLRRACRMPLRRGGAIAAIAAAALFGPAQPSLADFVQQGPKLVGTGAVGSNVVQGTSVAVSADGNTAIVGGPQDDTNLAGAVWVYTRSGGVWAQQGSKLVGTGAAGAHQGNSVAVSADGNTAIVGGSGDSSQAGAA